MYLHQTGEVAECSFNQGSTTKLIESITYPTSSGNNPNRMLMRSYELESVQTPGGAEGYVKSGYKSQLSLPSSYTPAGSNSREQVLSSNINFTGIWNNSENNVRGNNLRLAFSTNASNYSSLSAFRNALKELLDRVEISSGGSTYTLNNFDTLSNSKFSTYSVSGTYSAVLNLSSEMSGSTSLQNAIQNAVDGRSLRLDFIGMTETTGGETTGERTTVSLAEGFIKSGYRSKVGAGSTISPAGSISSPTLLGVEITGFWNDSDDNSPGSNLYLAFSSDSLSSTSAVKSALDAGIVRVQFRSGSNTASFTWSDLSAPQNVSSGGTRTVVYNLSSELSSSSDLRAIVQSALNGQNVTVSFFRTVAGSDISGAEGYIKADYEEELQLDDDLTPAGSASSVEITTSDDKTIEVTGLWNDANAGVQGENLYLAFSGSNDDFDTNAKLTTAIKDRIKEIKIKNSTPEYKFPLSLIADTDISGNC